MKPSASAPLSHLIQDSFSPREARALRRAFESRMGNPSQPSAPEARFCWDPWTVPGQYSLLRTPASVFFPHEVLQPLFEKLLQFASKRFGCRSMTPVWLSLYVDGCEQDWHADLPHGAWAFVYSLTLPSAPGRDFSGGETLLLRENTLNYWQNLRASPTAGRAAGIAGIAGIERPELIETITPDFDRLIVFDPRIPHRVSTVRGTRDPLKGRLVLHGWFSEPTPFLEGALSTARATPTLNAYYEKLPPLPSDLDGSVVLRLKVLPSGRVSPRGSQVLVSSLRSLDRSRQAQALERELPQSLLAFTVKNLHFPKASGATTVTLPLSF
jgi:hypothetical protein